MRKNKSAHIDFVSQSMSILDSLGYQEAVDSNALKALLSPAFANTNQIAITLPKDDSKETVDFIMDEQTGSIVGWRKTPRTSDRRNVTMKVLGEPSDITPEKTSIKTRVIDKILHRTLKEIAEEIDEAIKPIEVLQRFDKTLKLPALTSTDRTNMAGQRVLLLIHGIFSKTAAAFNGLTESYAQLEAIYGDRIMAYDHFTLSKSTKENAADLLKQLPENTTIDIICHSRGAGVTRFLVEHSSNRKYFDQKHIHIGKVFFVAGACEGSPLATKESASNLFKLLSQGFAFGGASSQPWIKPLGLLVRALVSGVQEFPGVKSMNPYGADIITLAGSEQTAATDYYYIRSNFDPKNLILRFGEQVAVDMTIFKSKGNDLIVPWDGASAGSSYLSQFKNKHNLLGFKTDGSVQPTVLHTNFFDQKEVREKIIKML